jgi:hypothetical protein
MRKLPTGRRQANSLVAGALQKREAMREWVRVRQPGYWPVFAPAFDSGVTCAVNAY